MHAKLRVCPGFLWNGRASVWPGLSAHVHDSYISGVGTLHAAMLGLFTAAQVQGRGEIARGELMRYFAEMVWYPPRFCRVRAFAGRR
jgi:hypothetical protein